VPRERTNFAPIWILVSLKVEGPEPAGPRDRVAKKSLRAAQADEANRNRYHAPKSRHSRYFFLFREALRDPPRKSLDFTASYKAILTYS
jgi:hypothetical protein